MNQAILLALYVVIAGAALQDVAALRISNIFPAALILLFGLWLTANGISPGLWQNGLLFLLVLAIGIGLFAARWLGGGDVKLLAAAALWFDLHAGLALLVYMSLCGGLLSLILVFARRMIPVSARKRLGWPGLTPNGPIPYGVAISTGIVLTLMLNGPNPSGRPQMPELHLSAFPDSPISQ